LVKGRGWSECMVKCPLGQVRLYASLDVKHDVLTLIPPQVAGLVGVVIGLVGVVIGLVGVVIGLVGGG
jgi:hypothetical protein